jgi:hypothetical protein
VLVGQLHHVGLQLLACVVVVEAALLLHELHQADLKVQVNINSFKKLLFCSVPDPDPLVKGMDPDQETWSPSKGSSTTWACSSSLV